MSVSYFRNFHHPKLDVFMLTDVFMSISSLQLSRYLISSRRILLEPAERDTGEVHFLFLSRQETLKMLSTSI